MIKKSAPAKINLTLDVTGLRDDGYHLVRMVMQSVSLCDELVMEKLSEDRIMLTCSRSDLETDESNLVCKAAALFKESCHIKEGVKIHLVKHIPLAAGLAGGSSDAAATLKGLNDLFEAGLSEKQLMGLGEKIGADVPYCIMGHTALAEGIGEKLSPLKEIPDCRILLAKPVTGVSTGGVYKALDALSGYEHPDTEGMLEAIEKGDLKGICERLCNVLELVTAEKLPLIKELKERMLEEGAIGALMSGSGPTVFGVFDDPDKAEKAEKAIKGTGFDGEIFTVRPQID